MTLDAFTVLVSDRISGSQRHLAEREQGRYHPFADYLPHVATPLSS